MAGEEKLKHIGEAIAKALGSEGHPPVLGDAVVEPPKPAKKDFVATTTEKVHRFKERVAKGVPDAAKKIVHEGELPRDARVLSIVEDIVDADESTIADSSAMRQAGEKLLRVMHEAGPGSETAREANVYLQRITSEHNSLMDLRVQAQEFARADKSSVDRLFDSSAGDALAGTGLEEKLKEYQQMLRYDEGPLHDTHKISQYIEEIKKMGYKYTIPEHQVGEAVKRLQAVIDETKANSPDRQELGRGQSGRSGEQKRRIASGGNWIYDTDEHGNIIEPQDERDAQGRVVRDKSALRSTLRQINGLATTADSRDLASAYEALTELPVKTEGAIDAADLEHYKQRIKEYYATMNSERFNLTPEIIRKLEDPMTRDEVFFERIKVVLDDADNPSHKTMNLYRENELDMFLHAVSRIPNGEKMVTRFNNLKNAIFAFHDLDFYTRGASGDIKSYKTAAHYFQNAFAVQALSDPIVETMLQSYEQALKIIRNNNDGYIPPGLVSYSPKTGENYWDKLTMQIFEEKVKAGLIFDYKRGEHGFGELTKDGRVFKVGTRFSEEDLERQKLRVLASMRMAKGMGILNNQLLEIFAFSKTPGYNNPEYGTSKLVFSSKAYEGIARWFNPMADWFGKYKMGDNIFAPFFATILGADTKMMVDFLRFKPSDWQAVVKNASEGTLDKYLKERYGSKSKMLLRNVDSFAFSGRFGPLSGWGENDTTIDFTDLDREREGGALRMFKAKSWAEKQLSKELGDAKWAKIKHSHEGEELLEQYSGAYKAWLWVQTTLRSPTIVAGHVRVPGETYMVDAKHSLPRKLRSVVIEEILHINVERDVASEATPSFDKKFLAERISLLESDVMAVQQAALLGGPDHRPRDIRDEDFALLSGDRRIAIDGRAEVIDEITRRKEAKLYFEKVRDRMLGTMKTSQQWKDAFGVEMDKDGKLIIGKWRDGEHVFGLAKGLLSEDLVSEKQAIHIGMEDVQWRYMDLEALGERNWARRANDLEARSNTIMAMIAHLDTIRPHPNVEEIAKSLEKIYVSEKDHDPNEAHKFTYLWAKATGEIYRQRAFGGMPIVGRVAAKFMPLSIAQQIYGVEHGAFWSVNNMREYVGAVQQFAHLPHDHVDAAGNVHPYNIHGMEKDLVATRGYAIAEMIAIGFVLAAGITIFAAATKATEEESKHH